MIKRAEDHDVIPYSDLVKHIHRIPFEPNDPRLFHLLEEISLEEDNACEWREDVFLEVPKES